VEIAAHETLWSKKGFGVGVIDICSLLCSRAALGCKVDGGYTRIGQLHPTSVQR